MNYLMIFRVLCLALIFYLNALIAAGFQINDQNASGLGEVQSGWAATAEDASTLFYNPAGLTRLNQHQQIIVGGILVNPSIQFSGSATRNNEGIPPDLGFMQQGHAQGARFAGAPFFYYSLPLAERLVFGFAVNIPYGLETRWSKHSLIRYAATRTRVETINISPGFGFRINRFFSIGAGLDIQSLKAMFNQVVGIGPTSEPDSSSENQGHDWRLGWHVGGLLEFTERTRMGLSFRSQVAHHLTGESTLTGMLATGLPGGEVVSKNLTASVRLPATVALSISHDITDRLTGLATVLYTHWDSLTTLRLDNVASASGDKITVIVHQNFRNTWALLLGGHYQIKPNWLVRWGGGFDQSPTKSKCRDIRLPDSNRWLLGFGTQLTLWKRLNIDLGWQHIFLEPASIHKTQSQGAPGSVETTTTNGRVRSFADVVGLQLTLSL